MPLLKEGKAKDAFAKYPWFTTEGDPFTGLGKPVREARVGLVTPLRDGMNLVAKE